MNKKFNTVLFIFGATIVNIVLMLVLFLTLFLLYARFLAQQLPPMVNQMLVVVLLLITIAGTYFIYRRLIRWISNRIDMNKYFAPLFRSGKR